MDTVAPRDNYTEGRPSVDFEPLKLHYQNRSIILKEYCEQFQDGWYRGFSFVDFENEEYSPDFDTVEEALLAWASEKIEWKGFP